MINEMQAWRTSPGGGQVPHGLVSIYTPVRNRNKKAAHVYDIIPDIRQGPKPHHRPIHPTNRAKKPMTQYLHRPFLLALALNWRARGRRRRHRWWAHTHQTSRGDFRTELAEISIQWRPERPRDVNVGRQDNIAPNAGATGAPMSRLRARRRKIIIWTGGRRRVGKRRGAKVRRQRCGGPHRCHWRPH